MSLNISVTILASLFSIFLIIKIFQNYLLRKKNKGSRKRILTTADVCNILFNVGLFTAGIFGTVFAFGLDPAIIESLLFTQPILNFIAGILFIWFAIRNMYYGGRM